jgi:hypothetical protein
LLIEEMPAAAQKKQEKKATKTSPDSLSLSSDALLSALGLQLGQYAGADTHCIIEQ